MAALFSEVTILKKAIISIAVLLALCLCSCTEEGVGSSDINDSSLVSEQTTTTVSETESSAPETTTTTSETTTTTTTTSQETTTTTTTSETTTASPTQTKPATTTASGNADLPATMNAEKAKAYVQKFCNALINNQTDAAYDMAVPPDQEAELTKKHQQEINNDKNANDLRTTFKNRISNTLESMKKYNVTMTMTVKALSTIDKPDPVKKAVANADDPITVLTKIDISDAGMPVYIAAVEEKDSYPESEYDLSYEVMYVYRHGGKWYIKSPSIL